MSARAAAGGRIDRTRTIPFTFNGKAFHGHPGDTLASALLANNQTLIGRSFKYHRPRGFLAAGVEEPNGLFTIGEAARTEPNIPGTTLELTPGLVAQSQNAWPSPGFDLMAVNQLAAPFFAAGFYYKTFMGPTRGAWMFYEKFIRKAAGLGRASDQPDPDHYDTRNAFCEVAILGSGPAGIAAAVTAGRAGVRVWLIEQDFEFGGSLLSDTQASLETWRLACLDELRALPNVTLAARTSAFGIYDANTVALVERCIGGTVRQCVVTLRAGAIIHATGAIERPLVFPNNDRPGVMLASAARTYLNRYGVKVGTRAVILTNNDTAYGTARDLAAADVAVTLADLRADVDGALVQSLAKSGIAFFPAHGIADGKGVTLKNARGSGARLDCDLVLMSGGWSPTVHLTSHTGIKPVFDAKIAAFVPGPFAPSHFGAGAVMGEFTLAVAIAMGSAAGIAASGTAKTIKPASVPDCVAAPHGGSSITAMPFKMKGRAFVDFQNDVTAKDIRSSHEEGYLSVEHLKRYTTLGMGTDQGKTSNMPALAMMADLRGKTIAETGTTTFRPPYTAVTIGALAGRNRGKHFRPTRRSPLHDWNVANGATFIEAGPWLRAWYYDWAGNTPETAYVKEMELVRRGVGLADVSTLGKIDVQGPDAAEFLNRVYVNGFAKLPVGKARYGVMLNDDGVVLDDGTTTRLSDTQYFMTTTTAQAGEVMSWLEFLLQTQWTDLKVHVTSVTDQWAGMAVSGPRAREALALAFPGADVSTPALPHMGCTHIEFAGRTIRLIRLSFSGELAYEVYADAAHGRALAEHILKSAEPLGIRPYGLEALASLRIEKGHVAGLELDHRTTLDDLGLGKMAGKEKDFVGRALRLRPKLQDPERWSLVGIELMEPDKRLRGGAILFAGDDKIEGHGRGYITSVTWSVELGKFIALGLYRGGLKHEGADIVCAYPLKDEFVRARIVSPHFIDREGKRLHA